MKKKITMTCILKSGQQLKALAFKVWEDKK